MGRTEESETVVAGEEQTDERSGSTRFQYIYISAFGKEVVMNTRTLLILYYIAINLIGLSAMVIDKIRAMERRFRIPESVLFILALLGGSAGCIAGMIIFRHKKRKPAFRYGLPLILILQIGAWLALHIATSKIIFL